MATSTKGSPKSPSSKVSRNRVWIPESSGSSRSSDSEKVLDVVELEKGVGLPTLIADISAELQEDVNWNQEGVDKSVRF